MNKNPCQPLSRIVKTITNHDGFFPRRIYRKTNLPMVITTFLVFLGCLVVHVELGTAAGMTITVDAAGGADYTKIQDAVNAAADGDTVFVTRGIYHETVIINKSIHLIGENKGYVTVDGSGNDVIIVTADNVKISGLTIQNGAKNIFLNGANQTILTENTLLNSTYGVFIGNTSKNNTIYLNNFMKNTFHAFDPSTNNTWYHQGTGNYWDDYNGTDSNEDGIGDTPYLISGDGNTDLFPMMMPITEQPIANFSFFPLTPTTENTIIFNDTSTDPDGIITGWQWNFGDGNTSIEQHPSHKYDDNGVYNVTLTVCDNYHVTSTITKPVLVLNIPPTIDFTYTPRHPTDIEKILFTDISTDSDGYIVNWTWDFGDGSTSDTSNASHEYEDNGTYTVTLTVVDDDGANASLSKIITIANVPPVASFSYSPTTNVTVFVGAVVQFHDTSVDVDGTIVSRFWDFGDGNTSTEQQPTHVFHKKGIYLVQLTVTDNDGATVTESRHITVFGVVDDIGILGGLSVFDIVFIVFISIMVALVILLTKKYG